MRLRLCLRHLVSDDAERGADLGAQRAGGSDDADGDEGCDEAVLDGSRTRLVLGETCNEALHDDTPLTQLKLARTAPIVHP
jgi:hypothetical protein